LRYTYDPIYWVWISSSRGYASSVTYYADATEADDATPIPSRGGDHLEVDIHLTPVPALHVLFHAPDNGAQGVAWPMLEKPAFDKLFTNYKATGAPTIKAIDLSVW
jgi:hypothetical protein